MLPYQITQQQTTGMTDGWIDRCMGGGREGERDRDRVKGEKEHFKKDNSESESC